MEGGGWRADRRSRRGKCSRTKGRRRVEGGQEVEESGSAGGRRREGIEI
jgi:hypothetical protein